MASDPFLEICRSFADFLVEQRDHWNYVLREYEAGNWEQDLVARTMQSMRRTAGSSQGSTTAAAAGSTACIEAVKSMCSEVTKAALENLAPYEVRCEAVAWQSPASGQHGSCRAAGPNFRRWLGDADLSLDKWPADDTHKEYLERICSSISCRPGEAWV